MNRDWRDRLAALLPPGRVSTDEPMAKHTTFRIGGPADALVTPHNNDELKRVIRFAAEEGLPVMVIGRGSNLLVRDGGIRGMVIKMSGGFDEVKAEGSRLTAGAGVQLVTLARKAAALELTGLEFASGIPGSLGGALVMNAGAYDGEMKDVVEWVDVMDSGGRVKQLTAGEMGFSYRHSGLQETGDVALRAGLVLKPGEPQAIEARMKELAERRQTKQPLTLPSAGSVFRRPPGHYAGPLIEESGLKGTRVGGAEVSTLHANFIVNAGGATAADVLGLIEHVRQTVHARSGVWLEPEVRVVGEDVAPY